MAKITKGARMRNKIVSTPGATPTIPTNDDHTSGWRTTDIYEGEFMMNSTDDRLFFRSDNGIRETVVLDEDGLIPGRLIPANTTGAVTYRGTWDASTGFPPGNPPNFNKVKGDYYVVDVPGNTSLDGLDIWNVGDWAIYNGDAWNKLANTVYIAGNNISLIQDPFQNVIIDIVENPVILGNLTVNQDTYTGRLSVGSISTSYLAHIKVDSNTLTELAIENNEDEPSAGSSLILVNNVGKAYFNLYSNQYTPILAWRNAAVLYADSMILGGLVLHSDKIRFQNTQGVNDMILKNSNLGIGTADIDPLSKLTVAKPSDTGYIEFRLGSNQGNIRDFLLRKNTTAPFDMKIIAGSSIDTPSDMYIYLKDGGDPIMTFKTTEQIGFGIYNPEHFVHFYKTQNEDTKIVIENIGTGLVSRASVQVKSNSGSGLLTAYSSTFTTYANWNNSVSLIAEDEMLNGLILYSSNKIRLKTSRTVDTLTVVNNKVGVGMDNPLYLIHGHVDQNTMTELYIQNNQDGTLSGAAITVQSQSAKGGIKTYSNGYVDVIPWRDSVIVYADANASGGLVLYSPVKNRFQTTVGVDDAVIMNKTMGIGLNNTETPSTNLVVSNASKTGIVQIKLGNNDSAGNIKDAIFRKSMDMGAGNLYNFDIIAGGHPTDAANMYFYLKDGGDPIISFVYNVSLGENIGIKTKTPQYPLHIIDNRSGNSIVGIENNAVDVAARASVRLKSNAGEVNISATSSIFNQYAGWASTAVLHTTLANGFLFYDPNQLRFQNDVYFSTLTIKNNRVGVGSVGPVGLQTPLDPQTLLHVRQDLDSDTFIRMENSNNLDHTRVGLEIKSNSDYFRMFIAPSMYTDNINLANSVVLTYTPTDTINSKGMIFHSSSALNFQNTLGTNVMSIKNSKVGVGINDAEEIVHVYKNQASQTWLLVENDMNDKSATAGIKIENFAGRIGYQFTTNTLYDNVYDWQNSYVFSTSPNSASSSLTGGMVFHSPNGIRFQNNTGLVIGTGFNDIVYSTIQDSNGKYMIGGAFISYRGLTQNRIIRMNQNGSIDSTFVIGTGFNNEVKTIIQDSNGKYVIAGDFTTYKGIAQNRIIRLNQDGTIDSTFVVGTAFNGTVNSIIQDSNGKYVIGGAFSTYKGLTQNRIIRLEQDGTLDSTFVIGTGFGNTVYSIIEDNTNKYVIGGAFTTYNSLTQNRIVRLNQDGSLDSTFVVGAGFGANVLTILQDSNNKYVIGGSFTTYKGISQNYIVRLDSLGTVDPTFITGTGFNASVYSIIEDYNHLYVIGGNFTLYNTIIRNYNVRLFQDGTLDYTFYILNGFNNIIRTIIEDSNHKYIYGGNFTTYNGNAQNNIIRLNQNGSLDATTNALNIIDSQVLIDINSNVGSSLFIPGFTGSGWKIYKDLYNEWSIEADNMALRGTLSVFELLIQQIRATNGNVFVTSSGKVEEISDDTQYSEILTMEDPGGHGASPFAVNDLILCQRVQLGGSGDPNSPINVVKRHVRRVVSISGVNVTVTRDGDMPLDTAFIESGDEFVRFGNTTDVGRQGGVYLTADESNAPYIDIFSGVNSWATWKDANGTTKTKVRLGRLANITDVDAGLSGGAWQNNLFGLYSDSVYLRGHIHAQTGKIGDFFIDAGSIRNTAQTLYMNDDYNRFIVLKNSISPSDGNFNNVMSGDQAEKVEMYAGNSSDWGIRGIIYKGSTYNTIFQLGSTNQIAKWKFDEGTLWSDGITTTGDSGKLGVSSGVELSAINRRIVAHQDNNNYTMMFFNTTSNWGLRGVVGSNVLFQLGYEAGSMKNQIAGWYFDNRSLWNGSRWTTPVGGGLELDSNDRRISAHLDGLNYVHLYFQNATNWGIKGTRYSTELSRNINVFNLGATTDTYIPIGSSTAIKIPDNHIAGWIFEQGKLYSNNVSLITSFYETGHDTEIRIDSTSVADNAYVRMFSAYGTNAYGIEAKTKEGYTLFYLGQDSNGLPYNKIAEWYFDHQKMWSGEPYGFDTVNKDSSGVSLNASTKDLIIYTNNYNFVKMFNYMDAVNIADRKWGIMGAVTNDGQPNGIPYTIFRLGDKNYVAGWKFSDTSLWSNGVFSEDDTNWNDGKLGLSAGIEINALSRFLSLHKTGTDYVKLYYGNLLSNGTASTGTLNTLTDSSKTWTVNQFTGMIVSIKYGTGKGQQRVIASNTTTAITVSPFFNVAPDATSQYEITNNDWGLKGLENGQELFHLGYTNNVENNHISSWKFDRYRLYNDSQTNYGIYLSVGTPTEDVKLDAEVRVDAGSGIGANNFVRLFSKSDGTVTWGIQGVLNGDSTPSNSVFYLGMVNNSPYNKIADWYFDAHTLWSLNKYGVGPGVELDALNQSIKVYQSNNNFVEMYYESVNDWGLKGNTIINSVATTIFRLGNENRIAAWNFDGSKLYSRTISGLEEYGVILDASNRSIKSYYNSSSVQNFVQMYYTNNTNWGLQGKFDNVEYFHLGQNSTTFNNHIAGWKFDQVKLYNELSGAVPGSGKSIYIQNTHQSNASLEYGRGISILDVNAAEETGAYAIRIGQITDYIEAGNYTTNTWAEGSYGIQISQKTLGENQFYDIFRVSTTTNENAIIAGWKFNHSYIWTGTLQESDTYTSLGITLSSTGAIRSKNFYISDSGNAYFRGYIVANSGTIGSWNINNTYLWNGTLQTANTYTTTGITMGNGTFKSPNFYISTNGSAYFRGNITASSGTIGSWNINSTYLWTGALQTANTYTTGGTSMTIGNGGIRANNFYIDNATGSMYSRAGNVAGWDISSIKLYNSLNIYNQGDATPNPAYIYMSLENPHVSAIDTYNTIQTRFGSGFYSKKQFIDGNSDTFYKYIHIKMGKLHDFDSNSIAYDSTHGFEIISEIFSDPSNTYDTSNIFEHIFYATSSSVYIKKLLLGSYLDFNKISNTDATTIIKLGNGVGIFAGGISYENDTKILRFIKEYNSPNSISTNMFTFDLLNGHSYTKGNSTIDGIITANSSITTNGVINANSDINMSINSAILYENIPTSGTEQMVMRFASSASDYCNVFYTTTSNQLKFYNSSNVNTISINTFSGDITLSNVLTSTTANINGRLSTNRIKLKPYVNGNISTDSGNPTLIDTSLYSSAIVCAGTGTATGYIELNVTTSQEGDIFILFANNDNSSVVISNVYATSLTIGGGTGVIMMCIYQPLYNVSVNSDFKWVCVGLYDGNW